MMIKTFVITLAVALWSAAVVAAEPAPNYSGCWSEQWFWNGKPLTTKYFSNNSLRQDGNKVSYGDFTGSVSGKSLAMTYRPTVASLLGSSNWTNPDRDEATSGPDGSKIRAGVQKFGGQYPVQIFSVKETAPGRLEGTRQALNFKGDEVNLITVGIVMKRRDVKIRSIQFTDEQGKQVSSMMAGDDMRLNAALSGDKCPGVPDQVAAQIYPDEQKDRAIDVTLIETGNDTGVLTLRDFPDGMGILPEWMEAQKISVFVPNSLRGAFVTLENQCNPEVERLKVVKLQTRLLSLVLLRRALRNFADEADQNLRLWTPLSVGDPIDTAALAKWKADTETLWRRARAAAKGKNNYDVTQDSLASAWQLVMNAQSGFAAGRVGDWLAKANPASNGLTSAQQVVKDNLKGLKLLQTLPPLSTASDKDISSLTADIRVDISKLVTVFKPEEMMANLPTPLLPGAPSNAVNYGYISSDDPVFRRMAKNFAEYSASLHPSGGSVLQLNPLRFSSGLSASERSYFMQRRKSSSFSFNKSARNKKLVLSAAAFLALEQEAARFAKLDALAATTAKQRHKVIIDTAKIIVKTYFGAGNRYRGSVAGVETEIKRTRDTLNAADKFYVDCLAADVESELLTEMTRRQTQFTDSEQRLRADIAASGVKLDKWWMTRAQGLKEISDTSTSVALNILEASQEGPVLLEALIRASDTADELVALYNLGKLVKGRFKAKGKIADAENLEKGIASAADDALKNAAEGSKIAKTLENSLPKSVSKLVDDAVSDMKGAGALWGDEAQTAEKLRKYVKGLMGQNLTKDQIKKVLKAATDPAERDKVLGFIRDAMRNTAKDVGDFDFKSVGSGADIDRFLAKNGELPKDWSFIKNDYDVSIYVPPKTVEKTISDMSQKEVAGYLERLGHPPGTSLKDLSNPEAARTWIAEQKILDGIDANFTKLSGGVPAIAYDNMYFRGSPSVSTREDLMAGFGKTLSGFSDADKAVMKAKFGLKPELRINNMLRRGVSAQDIIKELPSSARANPAITRQISAAAGAPAMRDVLEGKLPVWRITDVFENDGFISVGGKKLVDLMQNGTGNPAFRVAEGGLEASKAGYLNKAFTLSAADGQDIVTEMATFFHYHGENTVDKLAKYFARGAFGRAIMEPKAAALAQQSYLSPVLSKYAPEVRMVMIAEEFGKSALKPTELLAAKKAVMLKYPKLAGSAAQDPVLAKFLKGVKLPAASNSSARNALRSQMENIMSNWVKNADQASNATGTGRSLAESSARNLGRQFTKSRLSPEVLKQYFGASPEQIKALQQLQNSEALKPLATTPTRSISRARRAFAGSAPAKSALRAASNATAPGGSALKTAGYGVGLIAPNLVENAKLLFGPNADPWKVANTPSGRQALIALRRAAPDAPESGSLESALSYLSYGDKGLDAWMAEHGGTSVANRLLLASTQLVLNPAGTVSRLASNLWTRARLAFTDDEKRHTALFRRLSISFYRLRDRLDKERPGNAFGSSIYPGLKDIEGDIAFNDYMLGLIGRPLEDYQRSLETITNNPAVDAATRAHVQAAKAVLVKNATNINEATKIRGEISTSNSLMKGRLSSAKKSAKRHLALPLGTLEKGVAKLQLDIEKKMEFYDYYGLEKSYVKTIRSLATLGAWASAELVALADESNVKNLKARYLPKAAR
ncbi:MAG: hypothetical protein GXP05_00035 [Alphaproteobacteria bacterium]|nr:hypothetical protein [Alphaproteobacteria bacterium]